MITALLTLVLAAPSPGKDAEAEVTALVKKAERAAFESKRWKKYARIFVDDAVWISGRRPAPDEHDYQLTVDQRLTQLKARYADAPPRTNRLFFHDETVELDGDTAKLSTEVTRHFFGGQDTWRREYTLKRTKKGWRVTRVRQWPLSERLTQGPVAFDDGFWLDADEQVEKRAEEDFGSRISAFVEARQYGEALEFVEAAVKKPDATVETWMALANLAFELGRFDRAREAAATAKKLLPSLKLPPHLSRL